MRWLIFIAFILFIEDCFSQTFIVDDGFDNGTTLQAGWTTSGGLTSSSGSGNFGRNAPSITLNTNAQVMTYSWTGSSNDPDNVLFCYRGNGSSVDAAASSILVEESSNGISFTTVNNIVTIQASITGYFSAPLLSSTRYVRIRYSKGGTNNTYIDDFIIRKSGNCVSSLKLKYILTNGGCTAATACEGGHEIIFCQNGNVNLNVNDLILGLPAPGGPAPKGTTIGSNATNTTAIWTNNASYSPSQIAYVNALNVVSGCPAGTFTIVPATNIIPPNANFLLFTGASPTHTFNFSNLCSSGPYYVVFSNLDCTGKFTNGSCTQCFRSLQLADMNSGCVDTRTYTAGSSVSAGDGIGFDPNVATTWSNTSTGCSNFAVLPIELLDFSVNRNNISVMLNWSTASETNSKYFSVERSKDALSFESLGIVEGAGNSSSKRSYEFSDTDPLDVLTYYRLKLTDQDGSYKYSKILAYDPKAEHEPLIFPNPTLNGKFTIRQDFENGISNFVKVMDYSGKVIHEQELQSNSTELDLSRFGMGVYILQINHQGRSDFKKLVLN